MDEKVNHAMSGISPAPPLKISVSGVEIRLLCNDIILYCIHVSLVKEVRHMGRVS